MLKKLQNVQLQSGRLKQLRGYLLVNHYVTWYVIGSFSNLNISGTTSVLDDIWYDDNTAWNEYKIDVKVNDYVTWLCDWAVVNKFLYGMALFFNSNM